MPVSAQESAPAKCVFAGTARNSVTRLGLSQVTIHLIGLHGSNAYAGTTNAAGIFRFENLAAGDYELEVVRAGYSPNWVLTDREGHSGTTLHLEPGQSVTATELWFTPQSSIRGMVVGPDQEPLADARVTLIAQKWRRGKREYAGVASASTDSFGRYKFSDVDSGRYLVYASRPREGPLAYSILDAVGQPEKRIGGVYHPNAPDLESAATVVVHAGDDVGAIDFELPLVPVFHVTGSLDRSALADPTGISLKQQHAGQLLDWTAEGTAIAKDGTFDIPGIPAGSYALYSFLSTGRDRLVSPQRAINVSNRNLDGVIAPAVARFELKGRVRVEGQADGAPPVRIFCEGSHSDAYSALQKAADTDDQGRFVIPDLTPDRYTIRFLARTTAGEAGFYLKEVRVDGVAVAAEEIDLTRPLAGDVEVVLSAAAGSLEGTVVWPDDAPSAQAPPEPPSEVTVVLVPESVASGDTEPVTSFLDQDSHFEVTDLQPGKYRAFAVMHYEKGLWQNPEFLRVLRSRGTAADVAENSRVRIAVEVLRAGELRRLEERIQ